MREASSLVLAVAAGGRGRDGASPTTRSPRSGARELLPERRDGRLARWRRSRAPTPRCWSPSGPSSPSSTGRRSAKRMANPLLVDGRNFLDAEAAAGGRASPTRRSAGPQRRRGRRRADAGADPGGGEGTRLRPLTDTVPKPVLPLAGRPHIAYVIDWLARHGVDDVVISCGHLAEGVREALDGDRAGVADPLRRGAGRRAAPPARSASPRTMLGRALLRPQRRRPLRPRPERAGRASTRARARGRRSRSIPVDGPERLRPRAPQRGRRDHRVPREARARPDRHRRDQRRRLPAGALGARR